jgi:hypothetical protein
MVPEFIEQEFEPRVEIPNKREMESFGDIGRQQRSGGQEILNMRNRMYDTGRMNNLSPIEKQLVGPGLGVSADTPATGGYQQMFRVNPINVGEYKLTFRNWTSRGWFGFQRGEAFCFSPDDATRSNSFQERSQ